MSHEETYIIRTLGHCQASKDVTAAVQERQSLLIIYNTYPKIQSVNSAKYDKII